MALFAQKVMTSTFAFVSPVSTIYKFIRQYIVLTEVVNSTKEIPTPLDFIFLA